jgi:quinol monooxygenase YgiN
MANQEVITNATFDIHKGQSEMFEEVAQLMIAAAMREPGCLGYEWFFSADGSQCHLIETYADADAMLAHINGHTIQTLIPKLMETASLSSVEFYGDPGPAAKGVLEGVGAKFFERGLGL